MALREGPLTELFESGKVKVKAFYKADLLTGGYATFHENGKPHVTATYRFGRLQGKLTEQDKLGRVVTARRTIATVCSMAPRSIRGESPTGK